MPDFIKCPLEVKKADDAVLMSNKSFVDSNDEFQESMRCRVVWSKPKLIVRNNVKPVAFSSNHLRQLFTDLVREWQQCYWSVAGG